MWGTRREREIDQELRFHIESQIAENLRAGMPPAEARRQAILAFGGPEQIREECRELRPLHWVGTLCADVRYALRSLLASPIFTLSAVASIALGIGANAAIFTLLHAALWKPLPVPRPHELFHAIRSDGVEQNWSYSWPLYQELRDAVAPYGAVFARGSAGPRRFNLRGAEPERVIGEAVTAEYFSALEISPFAGRLIDGSDDASQQPVVVLSYSFWTRRFRADPAIIGKIVQYQEMPFQVIGVAQAGFDGVDTGVATDVWAPTKVVDSQFVADGNSSNWLTVMVRGTDAHGAQSAIEGRFQRHVAEEELPRATGQRYRLSLQSQHIRLRPAASGLASQGRPYERALMVLMGIVGVVLLIACANVANLLLARNISRRQEIAVRMALGAGRARLASQLLSESLVLALAGAAAGLLLGMAGCRLLLRLLPASRIPLEFDLRPDATVLAAMALAVIATALLCGAGPVWRAWRLSEGGLAPHSIRITERTFGRKLLVIGQLALSLVLIAGAGLFLKTLHGLATTDLGFRPERVMAFEISFPRAASKEHRAQVAGELFRRLTARSGISATYTSPGVYENGAWSRVMRVLDGTKLPAGIDTEVQLFGVGPAFFETLGIRVLAGRTPDIHDGPNSPSVAVVNETFARKFFPSRSALGHVLEPARKNAGGPSEIVGVVADVKHMGVKQTARPVVYLPALQLNGLEGTLLVRAGLRQVELERLVRAELKQVDASARVEYFSTLETAVNSMISRERLIAYLSTTFGLLAALLAAVGLYGVMAYAMSRRTGEIGIRMALGARSRDIRWMALSESLRLIGAGVMVGVPVALGAGRLFRGLLYGVSATDPWVLGAATLVMFAVALLAGWLPAARAARIDPNSALRQS
jgi:putative ABC transport system permease protein